MRRDHYRIIHWVRTAVTYVFWILSWVCWIIDWIPRFFFDLLPCLLGVNLRKHIGICVMVAVDDTGVPALTLPEINDLVDGSRSVLDTECNIELCVASIEFVSAPDDIHEFTCDAGGFFSSHFGWFTRHRCTSSDLTGPITVYVIPEYEGAKGCAIPRTDFIVIGADASTSTIAHELGHHADLMHRDDISNVMHEAETDASTDFTRWQCCMIRTARFATIFNVRACQSESIETRLVRPLKSGWRTDG